MPTTNKITTERSPPGGTTFILYKDTMMADMLRMIVNAANAFMTPLRLLEIRLTGFDKGATALKIIHEMDPDFVLCMGDDTTDEDMFKALEGEAYTIKVSNGSSSAQYSILSQQQVLPFLSLLTMPSNLTEKEYAGK